MGEPRKPEKKEEDPKVLKDQTPPAGDSGIAEEDDDKDNLAEEADEAFEEGQRPEAGGKAEAGLEKLQFPLNVVESAQDKQIATLQNFLLDKTGKVFLPIEGKDDAYMSDLLERLRKERSGETNKTNPGHPEFGPATKELFAAYKKNLESRELKAVMQEMSTMDLGAPSLSPEALKNENAAGKMLPEHPSDFLARMRRGETEFKLQTADNAKMVEVDTNKPPTDDVIQRIRAVENFMTWANDKVILDRKLRYHENKLEERIKKEGWPPEWLESPMKKNNRAGWCMAVMERMTDSTGLARSIESLYATRTKDGMANYGDQAMKDIPKHVHIETETRDGKVFVKSVKFDHPLDLDLKNPDFLKNRKAEIAWQTNHGSEIDKLVVKRDMAHADIKNFLFQGDVKVHGMQCIVDKKTNEILGMHSKEVMSNPAKLEAILKETGKKREDVTIEDADLLRCRIKTGEERGESNELKFITVDYSVQYGKTPPVNYHNLFMSPVGKASRPSAEGEADGLQRFKPDELVMARDGHGQDKPMPAKDVGLYADFEDLKRVVDVGVSFVMDASLAVGIGAAFQGVRLIRAANGAMNILRASQAGIAAANGVATKELAAVGYRMVRHGVKDFFLGASSLINNDTVQQARGMYFLGHAVSGLPGINRATSAIAGRFGGAKDAETLKTLKDAVLADGKTIKDLRTLGLSEGSIYSAMKPMAERGFRYSNYAFAGIITNELYHQGKLINNIGAVDGFAIAKDRMKGVDTSQKKRTPEEERVRQEEVQRTASRLMDDYKKNATGDGAASVNSIFDRTKALLEPPPKGLKAEELAAFNAKRKADIEQFQKELRLGYLQFDGKRVSDLERQRAEKTPASASTVQKLKDDPVLVQGVKLESDKLAQVVEAYRAKEEEFKKLGETKDEAERNRRRDELGRLHFQKESAQARYDDALAGQAEAVRRLETTDPKLDGGSPERKFADKQDAQKAAALAYLLLHSADGKELPKDGVLAKESIAVPGWDVTKTWTESAGDSSHTVTEHVRVADRTINQSLTVDDLALLLNGDLSSDASAMRRITTSEALDRLRVIPPEVHASVLKRIAQDPTASASDRSRAIADLGAVIVQLELDEAGRMASGMSMAQQLGGAGERFGNTSKDLKDVLAKIAANSDEKNNDVRAMATYLSYALDKRSSKWDDSDRDFFAKTVLKDPPGISYDQLLGYLKPLAGMKHGDAQPVQLEEKDIAGWERRARALVALEKLCNPKDGASPGRDFSFREINTLLSQCAHPSRAATTAFVMNAMLDTVNQDGVARTRLQQLTLDNPRAAMDLRRRAIDLIKAPFSGDMQNDANARAELTARIQLVEQLPEFLKPEGIGEQFAKELQGMREEAGRIAKATLCAADEVEIRALRAALRDATSGANANPAAAEKLRDRLETAERDMVLATGCNLNPDSPQVIDLANRMRAAKNPEEAQKLQAEWTNAWGDTLVGTRRKDAAGKDLPDLSSLNAVAYNDAELRKAAIRALGEMGAGDDESRRILKERAMAPVSDALRDCRSEGVADVRLASLNALQKSMAPIDFSRLCNELLERENSPGVAAKMRLHTWYSDIGLDPQSARYQDLAAKADAYIKPYKNIAEIEQRYKSAAGSHYWLSGSDLGAKLAVSADQYNWFTAAVTNAWDSSRVANVERKALLDTYNAYRARIKSDIIEKVASPDAAARKTARELCFGILVAPPEGFKDNNTAMEAQKKAAYSNVQLLPSEAVLRSIQMQAATALSDACKSGSPERDQTGAYIYQALARTTDFAVKRELLKGLNYLSQNKVGGPTDKTEAETLVFDPNVGAKLVLDQITDSIAESSRSRDKSLFQLECADFLRKNMTPDVMRQSNLFADLDGRAKNKDCPPALKNALWDIVADKRDRVLPVWGACKVDTVNASPEDRMQLLKEAAREVNPNLLGGSESANAPLVDGSEKEARVPSAVYKIIAAVKDSPLPAGDPRIAALQALASNKPAPGEKQTDERVRLAAAFGLYKQAEDFETSKSSIDTIVDVAVNGFRPGARRDAMEILAALKGDYLREAERKLMAARARTEDSSGKAYPKADVDMMEAARLGLLGKVQLSQNKTKEAEISFRGAFNTYIGKPVDAELHKDSSFSEEMYKKLDAFKQDRRFREVADTVENLNRLRPDASLSLPFSMYHSRYDAFGPYHPETINSLIRSGTQQKKFALEREQREGRSEFISLADARDSFVYAYNGAAAGFYPMPLETRTGSLDQIGDISLILAPKEHPMLIGIGHTPRNYYDAAYDLGRAEKAYRTSLELKEKYKVPAAELAQAHYNLARVHEAKAKLLPGQQEAGLAAARAEVDKALQIAKSARDNLVLSEQLRNAADFYQRTGDAKKSSAYQKEAMDIVESKAGKGSLAGKNAEEVEATIASFKTSLGADHPLVARLLCDASNRYVQLGKLDMAEKHADAALAMYKAKPPENTGLIIDALNARHQAMFRQEGKEKTAGCVESLTWLKDLQEAQAKGGNSPALNQTRANLSAALATRAAIAAESGDAAGARKSFDMMLANEKIASGVPLSADAKERLSVVASQLEHQAVALRDAKKFNEAGELFNFALSCRLQQHDGKLPEKVQKDYQSLTNQYQGYLVTQLKSLKDTGKMEDCGKSVEAWVQLSKQLNKGALTDEMVKNLDIVTNTFGNHIVKNAPLDAAYDAAKMRAAEPVFRSWLSAQRERLQVLKEKNGSADQAEKVADSMQSLMSVNWALTKHYQNEKQFAKAESITDKSLETARTVMPDSPATMDLLMQKMRVLTAQGKREEALAEIEKHVDKKAADINTEDGIAGMTDVIRFAATLECEEKLPGFTADAAARTITAINRGIQTLPKDKQVDALAILNTQMVDVMRGGVEQLNSFIKEGEGFKKLTDGEKEQYQQSLKRLSELKAQTHVAAENPLKISLEKWRSTLTGDSNEATPKRFRELVENYSQTGRYQEGAQYVRDHVRAVMEKGTPAQAAEALEIQLQSLNYSDASPEQVADITASLAKDVLSMIAEMPEGKRDQLYATVGAQAAHGMQFNALSLSAPSGGLSSNPANADPAKREAAAKKLNAAYGTVVEKLTPHLLSEIEKFEKGGAKDTQCRAFYDLLQMNMVQGKKQEALALANKHLNALLGAGKSETAAQLIDGMAGSFGLDDAAMHSKFLLNAKEILDKQVGTLPAAQKEEMLARVAPVLADRLRIEADVVKSHDQTASQQLLAKAKDTALAAKEAMQTRLQKAVAAKDENAIVDAYQKLASSYITLGAGEDLKKSTETFVRAMNENGKTSRAMALLQNSFDQALRNDSSSKEIGLAALAGLQMVEDHIAKVEKKDERGALLRDLAYTYERLTHYMADKDLLKVMKEKSDKLRLQADSILTPAGTR